jgi:IS5 family transposase
MGYKKIDKSLDFADLALASTLKHNRSLKLMEKIDKAIDWSRVESILMGHYVVGTSSEGADAYPPLLLFKCFMLQKWFHINSDPELENQINTINEGVAIDARLVKSASRPISNKEIKKQKKKRNTPEGKLDKNGKPLKFSRNMESDWIVKNDKPHYGLKEHASVDINHGFILATTLTPASVNDTNYLSYCTIYSRHTNQPIKKVYADKGYFGEPNRNFLSLNNIADGIMRKNTTTAKLTSYEKERNKKISKVRYIACPVTKSEQSRR